MLAWRRLGIVFAVCLPCAHAQQAGEGKDPNAVHRFELGAEYTDLGFVPCRSAQDCSPTPPHLAAGPSVAVNLSAHLALDGAAAFLIGYDSQHAPLPNGSIAGGHGLEMLAGPRAEIGAKNLGLFAGVKGGVLRWSSVARSVTLSSSPNQAGTVNYGPGTYFAIEGGGGVDFRFAPRTRVRVGIADQVVDYGHAEYLPITGTSLSPNLATAWVHNAILRAGVFYAAGPAVGDRAGTFERTAPHRFFDRTNTLLIVASLLAQTADAVTTQRFEHHGGVELNALMRPFVNQGWPGQVGAAAIENTLEISLMFGLHKMRHHVLERAPAASLAAIHGIAAYRNLQFQ